MNCMPSTAARAPAMVVKNVMRLASAWVRMVRESAMALRRSSTVLITSETSPFLTMSTMCGRPSVTLLTTCTGMPAASISAAVPRVATSLKPRLCRPRATSTARGLSWFRTLMKTVPESGRRTPAASCDLTKASPKLLPTPMTSPVDFISGPRMVSTPGNLTNGKTASLTLKYGGTTSRVMPWSASVRPAMARAAILASCRPVALDTYGTVREARGFTSST
ncbi:Uncharacterised protein [Bordetella pertussis]|nr:Uncharacterised protein [Bordetella pertussis]